MDAMTRKHIATTLRSAASALEGEDGLPYREPAQSIEARGPLSPRAVFRYGSKPNQAPILKFMREFLGVYAQAGNDLMEGRHPGERVERLQNLATRIGMDMDELISAVRELAP